MEPADRSASVRPLLPPRVRESRGAFDEALLELAEQLLGAGQPAEVASAFVEFVVTTYGFPRVVLLSTVSGRLTALASHGAREASVGLGSSAAVARAHELGETQVVDRLDPVTEPWLARLLPPASDALVVPLSTAQHAVGALLLQIPMTLRDQQGRRLLAEVERSARYAAMALDTVQRLVQLQRLAATDDLTMIANRRSFLASLDREIARSVRRGEPVSLIMLDLDHFKSINDVHGHPAGDEALRNVAAALTIASRTLDTPARYGGEEFAVILPDCDAGRAVVIADRFRAAVAAAPAAAALTASAGVATFPAQASDAEELVRAADQALLEAKRAGRDRTVSSRELASPPRQPPPSQ